MSSAKEDEFVYHITGASLWREAKDDNTPYRVDSLQSEGFIHFSRGAQVPATAGRYYKDRTELVLLKVEVAKCTAEMKFEPPFDLADKAERFPHLYGELNLDAVVGVEAFDSAKPHVF
jgi:uncharacterized protein (DUF952 family)